MGGKAKSIKPLHKKKRKKGKGQRKKKGPKKRKKEKKRDNCYYLFSTLVLQSSTMFFIVESLMLSHFHMLVGIFIIELGLYIPTMSHPDFHATTLKLIIMLKMSIDKNF